MKIVLCLSSLYQMLPQLQELVFVLDATFIKFQVQDFHILQFYQLLQLTSSYLYKTSSQLTNVSCFCDLKL